MITDPKASVTLLLERTAYCTGDETFCSEHGWGAHTRKDGDRVGDCAVPGDRQR